MAHEVLPVVKHTPVLAGVNGTDPFVLMPQFLAELKAMGFSGVQNFPTIGLFDGVMRASFEETGMGYGLEVDMIREAHELDLLTTPYVFNPDEARTMAEWLAERINRMEGPVRFLIPEGGVSLIDAPGQPFHDPEADRALFAAIEQNFRPGTQKKLLRLPLHINDEAFADALVAAWHEIASPAAAARRA
jgi:hypothetical protein